MPGLDFASAELLGDWAVKDPVFLPVSEGYHYYKIDVNNAINNLYVYVESYDPNAAGSDVQLFDSSETQYEDSPSPHHTILYENAPVGTNYIRVSDLGVNGNLTYRLTVYLVENGIHPTDLLPSDMTDIEMNSMQGVLPQIDNIESLDVELSHIVTADAPNPRFGGMLMSHNVQLNVDRYGGIVIDGKHNNRILGNTGTPQHSINGTVKNEGVPLEDKWSDYTTAIVVS